MSSDRRIVHVLVDDKFTDVAIAEFEEVTPGRHRFVMPGRPRDLKYVSHPSVEFVRRSQLPRMLNGRSCTAVVFHSLDVRGIELLPRLWPGRPVAWLGWGFDHYDRLLSRAFPDGHLLPATAELVAEREESEQPEARRLPRRRGILPWRRRRDPNAPVTAGDLARLPRLELRHRGGGRRGRSTGARAGGGPGRRGARGR